MYMDIYGPLPIGVHGERYALLCICKDSTFALIEWTKGRDFNSIAPVITGWRLDARDKKHTIEMIHTDSDPIFTSLRFKQFVQGLDINFFYAPPGQHWVNGYVERFIRTITGNGKTMLKASGLPFKYWFYALRHAVFLHNIVQSRKLIKNPNYKNVSAYEIFTKEKFIDKIPVFGQLVIARNSDPSKLTAWDTVGRECIFIGIDMKAHRSHILLNKDTKMIINSKDSHPVPNVYGYTMKPIVNNTERLIGRLDRIISNDSATKSQLSKIDDVLRISDVAGGSDSISTFSSSSTRARTPISFQIEQILLTNKRTLRCDIHSTPCTGT